MRHGEGSSTLLRIYNRRPPQWPACLLLLPSMGNKGGVCCNLLGCSRREPTILRPIGIAFITAAPASAPTLVPPPPPYAGGDDPPLQPCGRHHAGRMGRHRTGIEALVVRGQRVLAEQEGSGEQADEPCAALPATPSPAEECSTGDGGEGS